MNTSEYQTSQQQENKTIALAGVYLALDQIQTLAWHGTCDQACLKTSIDSLFSENPQSFIEVYGSVSALENGLEALKSSLSNAQDPLCMERNKYLKKLMYLSKKFNNNNILQDQIGTTLNLISSDIVLNKEDPGATNTDHSQQPQYAHYPSQHMINRIAELYRNTLSTIKPKIIIYGQANILATADHAATIRALLLCAVRGTQLWYQAGGSGLSIVLNRSKYNRCIDHLLSS
jgi:high frequency lysogenization protein